MVGNFGDAEVFSFHATKFFNTFEGGGIATNNDELAKKLRLLRNFGCSGCDNVMDFGINAKMSEVCAAMGLTVMEELDHLISINFQNYQIYRSELSSREGIKLIKYDESEKNNYQYIVMEVDETITGLSRDNLIKIIHAENVLARRYFYPGCHQMRPYRESYKLNELQNTDTLAKLVMSLPSGQSISEDEIKGICGLIKFSCDNADYIKSRLSEEKV